MEERHGWVLATFPQRLAAFLIDSVLTQVPGLVLILALIGALVVGLDDSDDNGVLLTASIGVALVNLAVLVGYAVWWLFALRGGQTPGKQIVGIRAIRDDGTPSDWSYTFLREFVIKFLLGGFLSGMTGGIYWVVDHLWPLFDGDRQALHDKMMSTLVVQNRR
jgi:uncharacterized RDD family membrane protein YckC